MNANHGKFSKETLKAKFKSVHEKVQIIILHFTNVIN